MAETETFQITPEQAALYEERFVPALLAQWVDPTLDAAGVEPGQRVLDVACGTGIGARHAVDRVGPTGSVTGVDLNPAMLEVAARVAPDLTWERGDAAALPHPDDSFDVVTCQSAAMFLPDSTAVPREMGRVARPEGTGALQVFSLREDQPAYGPWIDMVSRHAGKDAMRMLGTYWVHGDREEMRDRCAAAGLSVTAAHDHERPAFFPSVEAMVRTEVGSTPLADRLSPEELEAIVADSYEVFAPFRSGDEEHSRSRSPATCSSPHRCPRQACRNPAEPTPRTGRPWSVITSNPGTPARPTRGSARCTTTSSRRCRQAAPQTTVAPARPWACGACRSR